MLIKPHGIRVLFIDIQLYSFHVMDRILQQLLADAFALCLWRDEQHFNLRVGNSYETENRVMLVPEGV